MKRITATKTYEPNIQAMINALRMVLAMDRPKKEAAS